MHEKPKTSNDGGFMNWQDFLDAHLIFFFRVVLPVIVTAGVLRLIGVAPWLVALIMILILFMWVDDDSGN